MEITIRNKTGQKIQTAPIKKVLQKALKHLNAEDKELSVLFVDDEAIRELNKQYRHKDKPTDVLSFYQQEDLSSLPPELAADMSRILGDIIISVPTAQRQAFDAGRSLNDELFILLIHGLLHLFGYDHIKDSDAQIMREKESELLAVI